MFLKNLTSLLHSNHQHIWNKCFLSNEIYIHVIVYTNVKMCSQRV